MMVDYLAYLFPTEIARRFSPTYQGNRSNRAAMDEIDWYVGKLKTEVRDALTDLAGLVNDDKTGPVLIPRNHWGNKFSPPNKKKWWRA